MCKLSLSLFFQTLNPKSKKNPKPQQEAYGEDWSFKDIATKKALKLWKLPKSNGLLKR
jgi:topoisomerase IA-like protein